MQHSVATIKTPLTVTHWEQTVFVVPSYIIIVKQNEAKQLTYLKKCFSGHIICGLQPLIGSDPFQESLNSYSSLWLSSL